MKYKAIFCDFDGTLYSNNYTVSQENIDAINKYVKAGGKFIISTGRLFQSIYPHAINMGLTKGEIIVSQGSVIYDIETKMPIYQHLMEEELARKLFSFVEEEMGKDSTLTALEYINDNCCFIKDNDSVHRFCTLLGVSPNLLEMSFTEYLNKTRLLPTKVLAMIQKDKLDGFMARGKELFGDSVEFCASRDFLVEMMPAGIDKGDSVKRVAQKYGIMINDVICIGDSDNDVSMIKVAGLGVAVDNAYDRVKKYANYVTKSCDDNAIADVINKFCLGE